MIAPDYWMAQESQDAERHSEPPVQWICPYCGHEVADDHSLCCGEMGHAQPMTIEEAENG